MLFRFLISSAVADSLTEKNLKYVFRASPQSEMGRSKMSVAFWST